MGALETIEPPQARQQRCWPDQLLVDRAKKNPQPEWLRIF
jgi:hypothetical protein